MSKLSVAIIACDEEKRIGDAVRSASFADEVLVLDSGSRDGTVDVARRLGARVVHQSWLGFGRQKQKAVDLCANDWVFVLDSDERITDELRSEVIRELRAPTARGFKIARVNVFFRKVIKHCGLYPDYSIRLFDRLHGRFTEDIVHEKVIVDGPIKALDSPMRHLAHESVESLIAKLNRYSSLNARQSLVKALLDPPWTFFRIYVLRRGFLDGKEGFIIASLYSQYAFWKYVKEPGSLKMTCPAPLRRPGR